MTFADSWQWVDASHRVVARTNPDDLIESRLASDPSIVAWIAAGNTPVAEPALSLAQQAEALLAAGCAIVSTGTSALSGTYPVDAGSQLHVNAEVTSLLLNGAFADGGSTVDWLDIDGAPHSFTGGQYKSLAAALAGFVAGCIKVITGQATTLPVQPVTIS